MRKPTELSASGGNEWGASLRQGNSTANNLNQYTSRMVPGYIDVLGSANPNATVTANDAPTYRKGEYFRGEVAVANGSAPAYITLTNLAVLPNGSNPDITTNAVRTLTVAKATEIFGYDADGNLTNDSRWVYVWDAENRLVQMIGTNVADAGKKKLEFDYDYQSRRIAKRGYHWTDSAWQSARNHRFAYDRWNLVAELNLTNNAAVRKYVWGLDLSGTLHRAGGVGGLLAVNDTVDGAHFAAYDANGNVSVLVKATDSSISANYDYSPFGEAIRANGIVAKSNPFRFSTKYADDESESVYYGYRYYAPTTGRWLTRDPINEQGGRNLYAFVDNDPAIRSDRDGRTWSSNWDFFVDWATGDGAKDRYYGPDSLESREMKNSPPGRRLRDRFYREGCKDFTRGNYPTFDAGVETLLDPRTADWSSTAAQVGGFAGATATRNADGTVTFCVPNQAGTKSFFYHIVPNVPDQINLPLVGPVNTPGRTIKQTICWTEKIDPNRCSAPCPNNRFQLQPIP